MQANFSKKRKNLIAGGFGGDTRPPVRFPQGGRCGLLGWLYGNGSRARDCRGASPAGAKQTRRLRRGRSANARNPAKPGPAASRVERQDAPGIFSCRPFIFKTQDYFSGLSFPMTHGCLVTPMHLAYLPHSNRHQGMLFSIKIYPQKGVRHA